MTHVVKFERRNAGAASARQQFWVVGGEFRDTDFAQLAGPAEALGPYASYEDAYRHWERRSMDMKRHAHVRYTIVGSVAR